ncbi:MAG: AAA family ATPase [Desulfuromonadales bacterium]
MQDINSLKRMALSVAISTAPKRRQELFSICPKTTFNGLSNDYQLGKFFAKDLTTENFGDIAKATGIDPVTLVELSGEDETFRPLSEHLVRLLSAQLTAAQASGGDVTPWAVAIARIVEAVPQGIEDRKPLFMTGFDLVNEAVTVKRLIGKIIERGCTGQLFGPSGDGKSFIALDMLIAIATGRKWNGIQCEQGLVLYFAGEGHNGIKRRLKASSSHNGNPDLSLFNVSRSIISFDDSSLRQVGTEVKALEDRTGQKVVFFVIDTLARHLNGDENSTQHMSEFIRLVDGLRDSFPDSTALICHHTGNNAEANGRSRGSSALKAAMDFEIQCLSGVLTFTKLKDGEPPPPVEFKLQVVDLGHDADGEPITSCVPVYGERSSKNRQTKIIKLTATEDYLLKLITKMTGQSAKEIRDEYVLRMVDFSDKDTKADTPRRNFDRAVKSLIEKDKIFVDGLFIRVGHSDNFGQRPDMSGNLSDGHGHTPLRECPNVQDLSGQEFLVMAHDEFDFTEMELPL